MRLQQDALRNPRPAALLGHLGEACPPTWRALSRAPSRRASFICGTTAGQKAGPSQVVSASQTLHLAGLTGDLAQLSRYPAATRKGTQGAGPELHGFSRTTLGSAHSWRHTLFESRGSMGLGRKDPNQWPPMGDFPLPSGEHAWKDKWEVS